MSFEILTGRSEINLMKLLPSERLVHKDLIPAYEKLHIAAGKEGFDLEVISCFRSHQAQVNIWNAKAQGKRALLDSNGLPLNFEELSEEEVVLAIMRWSAIPGCSRHHWGTDIDVFDKKMLEASQVKLTPQEVAPEGPMGKLHSWLDELINDNKSFGFFRPYEFDQQGIAPEKWHLSFAPISNELYKDYTIDVFVQNIEQSDILLKDLLLNKADFLYEKYVMNICPSPF